MIAFAILAMLFAALARTLDYSMRLSENNSLRAQANALVEGEAEYLRSLQWMEIDRLEDETVFEFTLGNETRFSTHRRIHDVQTGLRTIELDITWTDASGREQTMGALVAVTAGGLST